jgi:hypothetical protein
MKCSSRWLALSLLAALASLPLVGCGGGGGAPSGGGGATATAPAPAPAAAPAAPTSRNAAKEAPDGVQTDPGSGE